MSVLPQRIRSVRAWLAALCLVAAVALVPACSSNDNGVCIEVDGRTDCVNSKASLAYEALREAGIELGPLDRVEPDYWAPVTPGLKIRVVRVQHRQETQERPVPFERRLVKTLSLEPGVSKVLQPGAAGVEAVSYLVVLEDGVEVRREQSRTEVTALPQDEVVAVGMAKPGPSLAFGGTVVYLAQGNAWVLRGDMAAERALTTSGDLDGRVFELSPDGRTLVFTRRATEPPERLNDLYAVSTEMVDPQPEDLGVSGVLRARWSPAGDRLAYSRAEGTAGSPGWRAFGDLWLLEWGENPTSQLVREESCSSPYCWWGPELCWAEAGDRVYLSDAAGVYEVSVVDGAERKVASFPPVATGGGWAWVPELSLVPGRALAALAWPAAEASEVRLDTDFDLVLLDLGDGSRVRLADGAGMWSRPDYGKREDGTTLVAYAVADVALGSSDSPYSLWVVDGDGSEPRRAFPRDDTGTVLYETAWAAGGYVLVAAEPGLYLVQAEGDRVTPLLEGVPVERVQWAP